MRKLVKVIHRLYRGGEKGFTLIELLVVIGILAALAGVVTLGVTQFIGRGCTEAAKTELHNIQTAVSACRIDNATTACDTTDKLVALGLLISSPKGTYTVTSDKAAQTAYAPCVP